MSAERHCWDGVPGTARNRRTQVLQMYRGSRFWIWICLFLTDSVFGFAFFSLILDLDLDFLYCVLSTLYCTYIISNPILYLPYTYPLPNCTFLTLFEFCGLMGLSLDDVDAAATDFFFKFLKFSGPGPGSGLVGSSAAVAGLHRIMAITLAIR